MAGIAAVFVIGIVIAGKIDYFTAFILLISFIGADTVRHFISKKPIAYHIILALVMFFGLSLSEYSQSYETNSLYPFCNKFVTLYGYVSEIPVEKDGRYTYIITSIDAEYMNNNTKVSEAVRLNTDKKLSYSQYVVIQGFLKQFDGKSNHNEFDYSRYMKSKGVFYKISDYNVSGSDFYKKSFSPLHIVNLYKLKVHSVIDAYTSGDDRGILKAIITGYKNDISDTLKDTMNKTGIIRYLYPAYLHIMIIACIIEYLFFFTKRKTKNYITVIFILLYALMNLNLASCMKTCMVSIISYIVLTEYGYIHFPDILSGAVISILLCNPLLVYNSGFVISVTTSWLFFMLKDAVFDFFCFIKNSRIRLLAAIWFIMSVSTAPLCIYYYGCFCIYSVFLSVIFFPLTLMTLILFWFALVGVLLFGKSVLLSKGLLTSIVLFKKLPVFCQSLPYSVINLKAPDIFLLVIIYLSVIVIKDIYTGKGKFLRARIICCIIIGGLISFTASNISDSKNLNITFVNVGQGDGAIITLPSNANIIVDGGGAEEFSDYDAGEKVFIPYLEREGKRRIDLAVLSHYHKDHCLGTIAAMKKLNVQCVAMPDVLRDNPYRLEIEKTAAQYGVDILYIEKGDKITFANGEILNVLSPSSNTDFKNENDTSIVFELVCNNTKTLFTGDSTVSAEAMYINSLSDIDILKVAHHGSDSSTSAGLLNVTQPEYSVISVGEDNTYALPDTTVLEALEIAGSVTFRTDKCGDISFNITPDGKITASTFHKVENN